MLVQTASHKALIHDFLPLKTHHFNIEMTKFLIKRRKQFQAFPKVPVQISFARADKLRTS